MHVTFPLAFLNAGIVSALRRFSSVLYTDRPWAIHSLLAKDTLRLGYLFQCEMKSSVVFSLVVNERRYTMVFSVDTASSGGQLAGN